MAAAGLELGSVSEGSASQVAVLARASQDLAVRMGGSSSETLQQMITNIQQLDTEGLRYMGIILDVTKAQICPSVRGYSGCFNPISEAAGCG